MKMSLICIEKNLQAELISYEWFRMWTRFETEAKGNSEMLFRETRVGVSI